MKTLTGKNITNYIRISLDESLIQIQKATPQVTNLKLYFDVLLQPRSWILFVCDNDKPVVAIEGTTPDDCADRAINWAKQHSEPDFEL